MQLKAVKVKGLVYYSIVESVRINGKPRHRYVKYIGSRDKLIESLLKGDELAIKAAKVPEVLDYGNVAALYKICEVLDLRQMINRHVFKGGGVDVGIQAIFMAINHCVDPVSKNKFEFWYKYTVLEKITGIKAEKLNAQNLCTALDYLYPEGNDKALDIEKEVVEKLKELFGIEMDCLYYDITSTYFEGTKCLIARLGYSRDGKPDKLQMNIGLVVTKEERFPVFHLVFEGNEVDIKTVGRAISSLKEEFSISDCLLIFDRGMVSEDNIGELDESGYDFICGLKKNRAVKAMLMEVGDAELLKEQNLVKNTEKVLYAVERVRELYGKERKVVLCYDTEIAAFKKRDRGEKMKRAEEELSAYRAKLAGGNYRELEKVVSKVKAILNGVSPYFKRTYSKEGDRITFDFKSRDDKIADAERLDGKYALMSTRTTMSAKELISAYYDKDGIEKAFCCSKQPIGLRPIRHWLDGRVKAHIFICYLSYLLMKTLEYLLKKGGLKVNAENSLKQLSRVKYVVVTNPDGAIITSKLSIPSREQREIMDVLGVEYIKSET
ncbi:MAG: IS1634 family transposase [Methanophagales archaeon ANME-1-THS]|nr:MAG: IS1634 family transposase [Methanophagales archaeon ANME-1-THS]